MYTDNAEAAYFALRVEVSLGMARASDNVCAKRVHEELAEHYRRKVAALRRTLPAAITETLGTVAPRREILRLRSLQPA